MEVNLELSPVTRKCFLSLWGSEVFPQKQGSLFITRNMGLSCGLQPQQNSHGSQRELWLSQLLWKMFFFFSFFFPSSFLFFSLFLYRVWNMKQFNLFCGMQLDFCFMKTSPQTGDGLMSLLGIQYSQWNPKYPSASPQREIHWILALIVVQLKIYFYNALFQELISQSCTTEPCFPLKNKKSKESSFFKKNKCMKYSFYMILYGFIPND